MNYIKNYNSFVKHSKSELVKEELLGDLFNAAKGAFKNFLSGIMAPFKNIKNDFKKGLKIEEVKSKMTTALDATLSNAVKNMNASKDENELNQMKDAFLKEIDEKIAEFDKEISSVKESKIFEGAIQDSLIGGRVLLGIVKDQFQKMKIDFDKKFAAAKDLAAKKQVATQQIKNVVDEFKKRIADTKTIEDLTKKYKEEKGIKDNFGKGTVIIDWGDVEASVMKSEKNPGYYQILSTNSKKLNFKEGENLLVKLPMEIKKGDKIKMTDILRNDKEDPLKEYETGGLERIVVDGKDVENLKLYDEDDKSAEEELIKGLTDIKTDKEKMTKVSNIVKSIIDDPEKLKNVEDLLSK